MFLELTAALNGQKEYVSISNSELIKIRATLDGQRTVFVYSPAAEIHEVEYFESIQSVKYMMSGRSAQSKIQI